MRYACLLETGQSELLVGNHSIMDATTVALGTEIRTVPTSALISSSFSNFTRTKVAADGVLSVYVNATGGPVSVGGGPYGSQTIQTLSIGTELQSFINSTITRLDSLIDLDFEMVNTQAQGEIDFFLDQEIVVDSSGTTLGIALSNSNNQRNWWELVLNGPALGNQPDYLRYALIHELGHALGLEHPFDNSDGDVFVSSNSGASAYPEETVMAYRQPINGSWPTWYSNADINALIELWGKEKTPASNLSNSSYPTFNATNAYAINLLRDYLTTPLTILSGNSYNYKFFNLGSGRYGIQLKGTTGIDEITGATTLQFNDQSLSLADDVAATFNQVKGKDDVSGVVFRLYNAAFSRLPDAAGLQNWINGNAAGHVTYASSAQSFSESPEFKNRYGSNVTDTQFITTLYDNVLGRAPDAGGLSHYQSLLASGRSRGALLLDFSESPENRVLFTRITGLA
ncbi:MAG: DUF4214 domain-containing protein [Synechococcaceae bacterium WB9_2_112]|nr:DUF4214 domain-containing protein [Synechococcaceae bacterium WB9_2_112]